MSLYKGKILKIDLTNKKISTDDLNEDWAKKFIGGKGLGVRYLLDVIDPKTKPLSSDNALIFMTGPIAGTMIAGSSRACVVTKSPATNTISDSYVGGDLAAEIKYAGYDAIIFLGKAEKPSYVVIEDDNVLIKDAADLWGKGNFQTDTELRTTLGSSMYRTATIGPAGENLITYATIAYDRFRHAGRGGVGAVMGSKNLKAVAIKGTGGVKPKDPIAFQNVVRKYQTAETEYEGNNWVIKSGTPYLYDPVNAMGVLPVRNFQGAMWDESEKLSAEVFDKLKVKETACTGCPLACAKFVRQNDELVKGPEYETIALGGPNCGIDDPDAIIKFNYICDDEGLDTMSNPLLY